MQLISLHKTKSCTLESDDEDHNANSDDEDVEPSSLSSVGPNDNNTESGLNPNDLTGTKELMQMNVKLVLMSNLSKKFKVKKSL